uniref:Uncharacterized protein n=1 Tax=Ananas comosus var. bracteatus TaxID=296719 RepID=A0A6V7NW38_ANACO|nr:unnamed protein product [Ananas comosus var. bracteatus]
MLSKFLLLSNGNIEKWVLKSLSRKWKDFKCKLKGKHMINNYIEQEVASNVPSGFTSQQWIDLVRYWFSEKSKSYSQIGNLARTKYIIPHTTNSMSFARKIDQFFNDLTVVSEFDLLSLATCRFKIELLSLVTWRSTLKFSCSV